MRTLPGRLRTRLLSDRAITSRSGRWKMKAGALVVLVASLTIGAALTLTSPVAVAQQDGGAGADPKVSVWSGVYTAAQNKRGEELHSGACAACHGLRLNGAGQPDMPPSP